jgi:hypothetical protein
MKFFNKEKRKYENRKHRQCVGEVANNAAFDFVDGVRVCGSASAA